METTSTQDVLSWTPPAATPPLPPVSKPRDTDVSLPMIDEDPEPAPPLRQAEPIGLPSARHGWRRMIVVAGGILTLAALVVGVHYYAVTRGRDVTKAAVAGRLVHVAPHVAGRVLQVLVIDNQSVQAGDLLVQLDPMDFSMKLNQRLAATQEAHGLLDQARWRLLAAEAAQALVEVEAVSARTPGRGTATKRSAALQTVAQLKATAAVAQVNLARAQVATAEARVVAAETALTQAGLDLAETEVRAPRSGRVVTTNVEAGEYVQAGKELLALGLDEPGDPANIQADQPTTQAVAVLLED